MRNQREIKSGLRLLGVKNAKTAAVLAALIVGGLQVWDRSQAPDTPPQNPQEERRANDPSGAVSAGESVEAKVVKVSDGDTITLLRDRTQIKIRLLGIDAPEKSQPFGEVCRKTLAELVAGKTVRVDIAARDRYGRAIGKVLVGDRDANLAQIEAGCAWHYKQYSRNQTARDRELYSDQELKARREKRGLWRDPRPQAPWEYRKSQRQGEGRG